MVIKTKEGVYAYQISCKLSCSTPGPAIGHSYPWFHFLILVLFLFWQGMYGIENEVFLSLPCILNARGLTSVINQKLKDEEVAQLKKSADTLWGIQKDLKDL